VQTYQPFPKDNAKWIQEWWGPAPEYPPFGFIGIWINTLNGDTILNSKTYCKIYYYSSLTNDSGYYAVLFDDTINRKVYLNFGTKDTLLYDFTLNVGDTIKETYNVESSSSVIICSIDSILLNNKYFKRYNLCDGFISIIEGIGSNAGLEAELNPWEYGERLDCFYKNDSIFFPANGICQVAGLEEISKKESINIYPNPANNRVTIEIPLQTEDAIISIYNITGQLLLKQSLQQSQTEISISSLAKGIYIIKVSSADGIAVKKFIKE
jgi:hypothetical protein